LIKSEGVLDNEIGGNVKEGMTAGKCDKRGTILIRKIRLTK